MRRIKLARLLSRLSEILPAQHPVMGELDRQPFFIFGSGRNGSTLTNRILNQHSKVYLPSEQNFLGSIILKYRVYNFLNWRDLMKVIGGELYVKDGIHTWGKFDPQTLQNLIYLEKKTLQNAIDLVFRSSSINGSKLFWGDSTPQNTAYIQEISKVFPRAKLIFLVRHPYDVVASYKSGTFEAFGDYINIEKSASLWKDAVKTYLKLLKQRDVFVLRYEELVIDPEKTIRSLTHFLGIDFEYQMLLHSATPSTEALHQEPQHLNLTKDIFTSSIGNWHSILTGKELKKIESIVQKEKLDMGY